MNEKRVAAILCAAIGLGIAVQEEARAVVLYTSEADFLAVAPIVSTETFDIFTNNYGFISPNISIDSVAYGTDQCTNRCWSFDGNHVSAPNSLISNAIGYNTLSFGNGRTVEALGFWFVGLGKIADPFLGWEIQVFETDGVSTLLSVQPSSTSVATTQYFGFLSVAGITSVTLRDNPQDNGAINWILDDVARGAILGGEPLTDSIPVPPPGLGGPDGPIGVPEPGTMGLTALGALLLSLSRRQR